MLTRRLLELTRDWRIRTIVPLVAINLLAFGGLYALMYHYAISNLVQAHKTAAGSQFDDLRLYFEDGSIDHRVTTVASRLQRHADVHKLYGLTLFGPSGDPIIEVGDLPQAKNRIAFTRPLLNTRECHHCHDASYTQLGMMQISFDLTQPIADATTRVRQKFALAGVAWIAVLGLLIWTGRLVIGRPLARIENSIQAPVRHDLDGLARAHRQREENIARQMVRAEQLASLGEIAAGLTHEIKNPLAGVIAALELLRSEGDPAQAEVLDQMLAELRRVTTTLDSLLRLAKPRPPQRTDVDLSRVVREVTSLFSARLRRQGVALDVEIEDDIPTLSLDSGLIVQLLVNLLTNSMQATDRGGAVTLTLKRGVTLSVSDTGRGIAPADLDRVFVPFFTTKEEGTGLGLAICRQIVEQHGGTIRAESEAGKGTTIVVSLPEEESRDGALAVG